MTHVQFHIYNPVKFRKIAKCQQIAAKICDVFETWDHIESRDQIDRRLYYHSKGELRKDQDSLVEERTLTRLRTYPENA